MLSFLLPKKLWKSHLIFWVGILAFCGFLAEAYMGSIRFGLPLFLLGAFLTQIGIRSRQIIFHKAEVMRMSMVQTQAYQELDHNAKLGSVGSMPAVNPSSWLPTQQLFHNVYSNINSSAKPINPLLP